MEHWNCSLDRWSSVAERKEEHCLPDCTVSGGGRGVKLKRPWKSQRYCHQALLGFQDIRIVSLADPSNPGAWLWCKLAFSSHSSKRNPSQKSCGMPYGKNGSILNATIVFEYNVITLQWWSKYFCPSIKLISPYTQYKRKRISATITFLMMMMTQ